jgi:hypothetical protein
MSERIGAAGQQTAGDGADNPARSGSLMALFPERTGLYSPHRPTARPRRAVGNSLRVAAAAAGGETAMQDVIREACEAESAAASSVTAGQ